MRNRLLKTQTELREKIRKVRIVVGGGGRMVKKEVKLSFTEGFFFFSLLKYKDVHILSRRKHSESCV